MSNSLDLDYVRRQFPALNGEWVFFDNAGGSQTLHTVVERIGEFLLGSDVQLGASYAVSRTAGERLAEARRALALLVNAQRPEEIVMGPTSTALLRNLGLAMASQLQPGDEIIVSSADHEVNISPWLDLERLGVVTKTWHFDPDSLALDLDVLAGLLSPRTRLVSVTHTSNIFGSINPIAEIARLVHAHGAKLCVDGVAYAPHRLIDVQALDVDFYVFSLYKVFGPHHAVMYGRHDHLLGLDSIYHRRIAPSAVPNKLEPGNANYELAYGCTAIVDYLKDLGGDAEHANDRARLAAAFDAIAAHETRLGETLLAYLRSHPRVRIIGQPTAEATSRVPTISFVVAGADSERIVRCVDEHRIGIRFGDFYSCQIVDELDLRASQGVVRVSMVHYNTVAEVQRLIPALDEAIEKSLVENG